VRRWVSFIPQRHFSQPHQHNHLAGGVFYLNNMIHHIYRIVNLVNGKIYIGQTSVSSKMRWYQHCWSSKNASLPIHKAIAKYGRNNFTFEFIVACKTLDDANQLEIDLIEQYGSHVSKHGYNVDLGGKHMIRTPETIAKIHAKRSENFRLFGCLWKGKPLSEDHKQAISKASMGKPGTNLGKKFSKEHVAKLAESVRLAKLNPNNTDTHKQCSKCEAVKLRTEFRKEYRPNKDANTPECKDCYNAQRRLRHANKQQAK